MKRVIILFLLIVSVFSFTVGAVSDKIKFNGIDDGIEWEYQEITRLIYGDSHCNVENAGVKYRIDNKSNDIWLFVAVFDYISVPDDPDVKLIIYAEDEKFTHAAALPDPSINGERFTFNALGHFDGNGGISYEVRLGVKNGIPAEYKLRLQFADSDGHVSNIYDLNIVNGERTTAAAPETVKPVINTTRAVISKAPKTTKLRTTKAATEKTTVLKTTKAAKSTAVPKTTAVHTTKPTTAKANKTAEPKTTKQKTTKLPKTETVTAYKNETAASVSASESADLSVIKTNLSAGEKYKTAVIASGTVAVILIAALCTAGKKRG